MTILTGLGGSEGYETGTAIVKRAMAIVPGRHTIGNVETEVSRFRAAQSDYNQRLKETRQTAMQSVGEETAEIFEAYQEILHDEAFLSKVLLRVEQEYLNVEYILYDEYRQVLSVFEGMDDLYLKSRAADIENVYNELIRTLLGIPPGFSFNNYDMDDIILVADNLTPSETMNIDKKRLKGFVIEQGGLTSHTVILARALKIPAIVGVKGALSMIRDMDLLLLDAQSGRVVVGPGEAELKEFYHLRKEEEQRRLMFEQSAGEPAFTKDSRRVRVAVNLGGTSTSESLQWSSFDGVGLLRTEFLFMEQEILPDEETLYKAFRQIVSLAQGEEVTIRTLDIGGDKPVPCIPLPEEANPFLGYRGIRYCLDHPDFFQVQLRAILRASAHGKVRLLIPMIVCIEELRGVKRLLEQAKHSLQKENVSFDPNMPVGVMIETPAAVLIADTLAGECDFFSIGTNDLVQYVTATDRNNEHVRHLHRQSDPAVLRAIRMVADTARQRSMAWGICGESAAQDYMVPLWVALGAHELSVSPYQVGMVKHIIRQCGPEQCENLLNEVFSLRTPAEIEEALIKWYSSYSKGNN